MSGRSKKRNPKPPAPLKVVGGQEPTGETPDPRREVKLAEVRLKMRNGFYRKRGLWNRLARRLLWELGA